MALGSFSCCVQLMPRVPLWEINMYLFLCVCIMYVKCSFINSGSFTSFSWSGALPGGAYPVNTWV